MQTWHRTDSMCSKSRDSSKGANSTMFTKRTSWFYVCVEQDKVAKFLTATSFVKTKAWNHQLSAEELTEAKPLLSRIGSLLDEITGVQLMATFLKRRVWPIRARAHPMWQYEGVLDSSRMSQEELSKNELVTHVRSITSLKASDPCNVDCPVTPYGVDNPLPEVSTAYVFLSSGFATHLFCDF